METRNERNRLVFVVPLTAGAHDRARELLRQGPPFDLEKAAVLRHDVYLTPEEVVFVFESPAGQPLRLAGEDLALWRVADEWRKLMAGRPRKAEVSFTWQHSAPDP